MPEGAKPRAAELIAPTIPEVTAPTTPVLCAPPPFCPGTKEKLMVEVGLAPTPPIWLFAPVAMEMTADFAVATVANVEVTWPPMPPIPPTAPAVLTAAVVAVVPAPAPAPPTFPAPVPAPVPAPPVPVVPVVALAEMAIVHVVAAPLASNWQVIG